MTKNLYAILGIARDASADEILAAHDAATTRLQPGDDLRRMALKEAIGVLGHVQRRAAYDASLRQAARAREAPVRSATAPTFNSRTPLLIALAFLVLVGAWVAWRSGRPAAAAARQPAGPAGIAQTVRIIPPTVAAAPATASSLPATARRLGPEALFAQASPSIVRIDVFDETGAGLALGSGVVIERGTVITNCHVTRGGRRLKVKSHAEEYDATVVTADEQHDLCKLSVVGLPAPPVERVKVASLQVGQKVYAIGSPQGLDLTLSDGMVSSLRQGTDGTLIQTSAPVSPGSSGGGLFTESGQLAGIVTFQHTSGQNLNFAIPADWIDTMSPSTMQSDSTRDSGRVGGPPSEDARKRDLLGRWNCYGPLTGRGLSVVFQSDGTLDGSFDGQPLGGRYFLDHKQLTIQNVVYQVEELTAFRMVLGRGDGRRLACNR